MVGTMWAYLKRQPRSILVRVKRHWLTFAFIVGVVAFGLAITKNDWARSIALPTTTEAFWLALAAVVNVVLLGAAIHGLQSLQLTRTRMLHQARRDARECAIKRCEEFAAEIIPMNGPIIDAFAAHQIPVFVETPADVRFDPDNTADIRRAYTWYDSIPPPIRADCHTLLNRLEAWAMYFFHGLADSEVAFGPIAPYYCSRIIQLYPVLLITREFGDGGKYPNIVGLYKAWMAKLEHEQRGLEEGDLLRQLKDLQEKGSPSHKLQDPIGTKLDR